VAKLKITNKFWITPNEVLNLKSLSFKAKGLYWFLQSKPDDWNFSVKWIASQSKESKDGISSWLKELENHWFLKREKYQDSKGQWGIEYVLWFSENAENPLPEKPATEKPDTGKAGNISKKDLSKKEVSKKDKDKTSLKILPEFPENSFELSVAKRFLERKQHLKQIQTILKKKTENEVLQEWADEVGKMLKIDKLKEVEIVQICQFAVEDKFWKKNVMSLKKFREKKDWVPYWAKFLDLAKDQVEKNTTPVFEWFN